MTEILIPLLSGLSRSIDKPVLDDPRLHFTPSERYFPAIGKQSLASSVSQWVWSAVTTYTNKEARIPLKLRQSNIQVAIGYVEWLDFVSAIAIRDHMPVRRRSPLFLADAMIETIDDPDRPGSTRQIIRLTEPPSINLSLLEWFKSYSIDVRIDPEAPIMDAFQTSDPRLCPKISEDVHVGIFLSDNEHLARSVDPVRNPEILSSRSAALLAGESIAELPPRHHASDLVKTIALDPQQKEAVFAALSGENFALIGPPGCGKSQTIAAIIINIVSQFPDLKIGVASPIAAALDSVRRLVGPTDVAYRQILIGKDHKPERLDLLIVDEASRTTTAAIFPFAAMTSQIVIVGDPNQTPPPAAAPRLDEHDTSLIDRALLNPNFSSHHLHNHYRSRHDDLLAYANGCIYNGFLRIVPAPRRQPNDGMILNFVPGAAAESGHTSTKNITEALCLAKELVASALSDQSRGIARSRMAVGWTYTHARLIEAAIKHRLKQLKVDETILSPVPDEPFEIYTAVEVQGQERDETWISFGHGVDPLRKRLATARQPPTDLSKSVMQKLNVLTTRSRLATHIYHSIPPSALLGAAPTPEIIAVMSLLYVESAIAHTRFELAPIREPNYIAERRAKGDPTMPNPVAVNLGSIFGVRDAADPPDCWRYGLFRYMKHWSEDEAEAFRAMCIAKGWQIVRF